MSQVHSLTPSGLPVALYSAESGKSFREDFAVFGLQTELYPMQESYDNQAIISNRIIDITTSYI